MLRAALRGRSAPAPRGCSRRGRSAAQTAGGRPAAAGCRNAPGFGRHREVLSFSEESRALILHRRTSTESGKGQKSERRARGAPWAGPWLRGRGTSPAARSPEDARQRQASSPPPSHRLQPLSPRSPQPVPPPGQLRAEAHGGAAPGPQRSAAPPWRLPAASRPQPGPPRPRTCRRRRPLPSEPRAHLRSGSPGSRSCGTWTAASCPPPGPEPHQGRRRRMRRRRRAGGCGNAVSLMRRGGRAAAATGRARGTRGAWRQQRRQRPPHVTAGLAGPSRTCASRVTGQSGDLAAAAPRAGAKRREEKLAASCLPPPPRPSAAPAADWAASRG